MKKRVAHQCQCAECQRSESSPVQELHQQMNFFLSTLDEHQQRLYVGLESKKLGHGGDQHLALITGMNVLLFRLNQRGQSATCALCPMADNRRYADHYCDCHREP
jgi:hypothetical protein